MTRLKPFRFPLANGQEAVFYAPTYSQAVELALTWRRSRGFLDQQTQHELDHENMDGARGRGGAARICRSGCVTGRDRGARASARPPDRVSSPLWALDQGAFSRSMH
jgi:hypothetical protein